ncbi:glycoside hydrolase family 99-like domain-containing protein [Celeribacter baekdonensis]|uniref:glycoside hydrolase family 99-like domain-containing protein n=1 Tax=Celeribacter baekdonensis TaxID=875171 RepID=UPI003A8E07FE
MSAKSRAKNALRFLFATPKERRYVRKIKASGQFDRDFYRGVVTGLHWLYRRNPERHYVVFGEPLGIQPNGSFSPTAYLKHNPDVAAVGSPPFEHFITIGAKEGRVTRSQPSFSLVEGVTFPILRADPARKKARFAIVVHVFYAEMWDEIAAQIKAQTFEYDLYVSYVKFKSHKADPKEAVLRDFPEAIVYAMPNHGRDIYPFLHFLAAGFLDGYEAVCKLHTKKSPHRTDGSLWRQALIQGILGDPDITSSRLDTFVSASDAGFWVADGQHYEGAEWWGSNVKSTRHLLDRIEVPLDATSLEFPAGSIYWLKPTILAMLKAMQLKQVHFQVEDQQLDGTTAHAVERALGYICKAAGLKTYQATELDSLTPHAKPKAPNYVTAFYLPQFHPIAENDSWWGKGYTEWTSVVAAEPNFSGHSHPVLPADLGFYDLRVSETLGEQTKMAKAAGIDAFCAYYYWFDGQRLLEKPIDLLLDRPDVDFPFYLCWANESWRRNWDGLSGEILMPQTYLPGFAEALARDIARYMRDPRYQRPDGVRPRFVIYRPEDMPDPAATVEQMRQTWRDEGIGEVELGAVLFHADGESPIKDDLFDFWVEMPPHGVVKRNAYLFGGPGGNKMPTPVLPHFKGLIYDYTKAAAYATSSSYAKRLPKATIAGIMPSWDNTARRGVNAHIAYGANIGTFRRWLYDLLEKRLATSYREELWINAWNEWAEKAVLEPTQKNGDAYLSVLTEFCGNKAQKET